MKTKYYYRLVLLSLVMLLLSACNNGANSTNNSYPATASSLTADQISDIPLINAKPTKFYFYITNSGTEVLSGLHWSLKNLNPDRQQSSAIILDSPNSCMSIAPKSSCALPLTANAAGQALLGAVGTNGKPIEFAAGSGLINAVNSNLLSSPSENPSQLVFGPLNEVNFHTSTSYSFFIVNSGLKPILIKDDYLLHLPANVHAELALCPKQLSQFDICQLRLRFDNLSNASPQNLNIPLNLQAGQINPDKTVIAYKIANPPFLNATNSISNISQHQHIPKINQVALNNNLNMNNTSRVSLRGLPVPVVTPNFSISAVSLFNSNLTLVTNTTTSYQVTLTNSSTATNNGSTALTIPYSSLVPANSTNLTYSISSGGSNPCPGLPTNAGGSLSLNVGSCTYNLRITAGSAPANSSAQTLTTAFSYWFYTTSVVRSLQAYSPPPVNSFNVTVIQQQAQLSVSLAAGDPGTAFNNVEQLTIPNPRLINLTITNSGNKAVSGSLTAVGLPGGITFNPSNSCTNLAANASCSATLQMSTTNTLNPGNLDAVVINYNNGINNTTTAMPSGINYLVTAPGVPIVTLATPVVSGCFSGSGISPSTCYNNPNNMGGTGGAIKVTLTFTNTSPSVAVTSLTLNSSAAADFSGQGYTLTSNSCGSGIAANNGTCTMVYTISGAAQNGAVQPNINNSSFGYTSKYGSQGQLSAPATGSVMLAISVVAPSMTIGQIASISAGVATSTNASITWSNLYQNSVPATTTSVTNTSNATVPGLTSMNPATCGTISANGATCSSLISSSGVFPGTYVFKTSAFSGVITANRNFSTINPVIFMTTNTYSGDLGGISGADLKCQTEAYQAGSILPSGLTAKALIVTSSRYPCNSNGNCGGSNALDWPLIANQVYSNPNVSNFNTSNSNAVFDGSTTLFYDSKGTAIAANQMFWLGAQSILTNNNPNKPDIAGWAYASVNAAASKYYTANLTSCSDYTSAQASPASGPNPNVGVVGLAFDNYAPSYNIPVTTWGNFFNFNDTYFGYVYNTWSATARIAQTGSGFILPSCASSYHLVCVAK